MTTESNYPIQPVWTLRNLFYSIISFPLTIAFISIYLIPGTKSGKDPATGLIYLAFFLAFSVLTIPANFIYNLLRLKTFHYSLDENTMTVKEGILTKQVRTVNYSSIQMVSVYQSFFDKILHLATLQVENASEGGQTVALTSKQQKYLDSTIGSYGNIISVPGLHKDDAESLKNILLDRIKNTKTVELGL